MIYIILKQCTTLKLYGHIALSSIFLGSPMIHTRNNERALRLFPRAQQAKTRLLHPFILKRGVKGPGFNTLIITVNNIRVLKHSNIGIFFNFKFFF